VRHFADKTSFIKSTAIEAPMRTTEGPLCTLLSLSAAIPRRLWAQPSVPRCLERPEIMSNLSNTLLAGFGFAFSVQGTVSAIRCLLDEGLEDDKQKVVSSHLQIYAGYFLMLLMGWLFVFTCQLWSKRKVDYKLIFELDPRHSLGWRTLTQFPSVFTLMFGVIFFLNFSVELGGEVMFLWYPAVLVGATLVLVFLPLPIFHHQSRLWFAIAHVGVLPPSPSFMPAQS